MYRVDPSWPKALPNGWALGPVCGVAIDRHQNVWIVHRHVSVVPNGPDRLFAPPVLEFSPDGVLLAAWGGPAAGYDWPQEEHGIYVDAKDNVWLGGAGSKDNQILKFTSQGNFVLQIGHPGANRGSNDTANLGGPASMVVDERANELYVADGYVNHRVIVFDATAGTYKRHWGAYGHRPDDGYFARLGIKPGEHPTNEDQRAPDATPPPQFDLVHDVRLSKDGLVYVGDRSNNRIQVFRKDGRFVKEVFIANDVRASGSTSAIDFSPDPQQRFTFVADSTNQKIYIVNRQSLQVIASIGSPGALPGQFDALHSLVANGHGDLFTTEAKGSRVQRFVQIESSKSN
jgi:DNA-binding beta-propeller fold protein YncE